VGVGGTEVYEENAKRKGMQGYNGGGGALVGDGRHARLSVVRR
jgi:hypothetical protein